MVCLEPTRACDQRLINLSAPPKPTDAKDAPSPRRRRLGNKPSRRPCHPRLSLIAEAWAIRTIAQAQRYLDFLTTPGRLESVDSNQLLVLESCATMVSMALNCE